jgi:hypothetical protein
MVMADNGKRYHCDECDEDHLSGMSLARHFVTFPEHRSHRQQVQWLNSQKQTKKKRRLSGRKRSSMYGRVRQSLGKKKRRTRTDKDFPCTECGRVFHSATHSYQHFQLFPHHRTKKQQADHERNLSYASDSAKMKRKTNGASVLPTVPKTTRIRKTTPAEMVMNFCTGCGMHRHTEHHYCGGCGVQL